MPSAESHIRDRVDVVRNEIAAACQRAGRSPEDVTLVAVSKQHSVAEIVEVIDAGVLHLGENRLDEALRKISEVAALTDKPVQWHMIGQVQERKARHVLSGFVLLHSLDSVALAQRLNRFLVSRESTLDVLLEINVSGEASKSGWAASNWQGSAEQRRALWDDVAQVMALPGIAIRGLMTMAPIVSDPEETRPVFAGLRTLRDALAEDFPAAEWSMLSMGMTDDYPVAIEEGATMVRVGRAIFGSRRYP